MKPFAGKETRNRKKERAVWQRLICTVEGAECTGGKGSGGSFQVTVLTDWRRGGAHCFVLLTSAMKAEGRIDTVPRACAFSKVDDF